MSEIVAAYIRVSTQEQKLHGLSLEAQTETLKRYAAANNLEIYDWYKDEGVSGRKLIRKRPELQRMLNDAQDKKFTRIIFIKLDRFFRSVGEYHECMKLIEPCTWTATEEKYDLTTANGRMFVNMKLTVAELEADQTGERIKLVNEHKVRTGMPVAPTRLMPFYYAVENRQIVKRNENIIMDLIEHVETHGSMYAAMRYVNDKYGIALLHGTVKRALCNPLLCGQYRDNPNYCEPYITRERFDALQKICGRSYKNTKLHIYTFQGMIKCPGCGRIMHAEYSHQKRGESVYQYPRYVCAKRRHGQRCTFTTSVYDATVERLMLEELEKMIGKFRIVAEVEDKERTPIDVSKYKSELERLNYAWEKGRLSVEEYDRKYDEITDRIKKADEWNRQLNSVPKVTLLGNNWQELYSQLDTEHRRAFWGRIAESIELDWGIGRDGVKRIANVNWL